MTDQVETRVAVLEKDFSNISGLFNRLDNALDKLADISSSVKQLLAVHDARLDTQEKMDEKLHDMIEKRRVTTDQQYEALHKRIGEVKDELYEEIDTRNKAIIDCINKVSKDQEEHHKVMEEKITNMEKWKWILIGGSAVVGYLIAHADFFAKFFGG